MTHLSKLSVTTYVGDLKFFSSVQLYWAYSAHSSKITLKLVNDLYS